MKATELTQGERLLLARRRKGWSQIVAARRFKTTLYALRAWEEDQAPSQIRAPLGRLQPHEVCFLLRRRKGLSAQDVAKRLGVTPNWLCLIERGRQPAGRLVAFWRKRARAG